MDSRESTKRGLSRREALGSAAAGLVGLASAACVGSSPDERAEATRVEPGSQWATRPVEVRFRIGESEVAPNGRPARAVLVDGQLPGPEIRVREGDILRVTVDNTLSEPTTVHWHGLLVPNPMDGVPGLTQKPIAPGQSYVYEYPLHQTGTYWYHSHYELQEQQGLHGAFIVEPRSEPGRYEREYVLVLSDWLDQSPYDVIPELRKPAAQRAAEEQPPPGVHPLPDGSPFAVDVAQDAYLLNGKSAADPWRAVAKPGERVRLRIINAAASSFFRFMVDGHALTVTHADGQPVKPVEVDNLVLATAERYDVVLEMAEAGAHAIRAIPLGKPGEARGVLHSPGAAGAGSPGRARWGPRVLQYAMLHYPRESALPEGPSKTFRLALGGDMRRYLWSINGQYYPTRYVPDGKADPLEIQEGDRVRIDIVNGTKMYHPMHLHGHFFRVLPESGASPTAPLKDTIGVAPGATQRLEFLADNPGHWFFHCHNLYHLEAGMARVWEYVV